MYIARCAIDFGTMDDTRGLGRRTGHHRLNNRALRCSVRPWLRRRRGTPPGTVATTFQMETTLQCLRRRRIGITGFEVSEVELISRAFANADALASVAVPGPNLPGANQYAYYDLCVLNCGANLGEGLASLQIARSHQPVLLIGEAEAVAQVMPAFTSVRIDFATRPYRAEELLLRADRLIAGMDVNAGAAARTSEQRRVLIADDEEVANAFIATILKFAGFECASARDGQQALEMARQNKPDVVLLDVSMPRLDGFEALAALRAQPETQHLPVIMVTGNKNENDIVRGFQLGADDYIAKPFNARELIARVDRAVRNAEIKAAQGSRLR